MKMLSSYMICYFSILGWTSNNWLMIWYMMEVCLVMFMGLMTLGKNYSVVETMMKYYLVQVFFSLLFLVFLTFQLFNLTLMDSWLVYGFLLIKMGLFPFHFWLILLLGKLDWFSFFMLSGFMKLIPLAMFYYLLNLVSFFYLVMSSLIVGSLGGVNNTNLQKFMGYSSMINVCWLLYSLSVSFSLALSYLIGYLFMLGWLCGLFKVNNIFFVNQFKFIKNSLVSKFMIFIYGLSLAGFPPFLGFVIKWVVVSSFYYLNYKFIFSLMLMFSLLSTYFYLQLFFYTMMVYSSWSKWYSLSSYKASVLSFSVLTTYAVLFLIY